MNKEVIGLSEEANKIGWGKSPSREKVIAMIDLHCKALALIRQQPEPTETKEKVQTIICSDCRQSKLTELAKREKHKAYMNGRSKGFCNGKQNADELQDIIDRQAAEMKELEKQLQRPVIFHYCKDDKIQVFNVRRKHF